MCFKEHQMTQYGVDDKKIWYKKTDEKKYKVVIMEEKTEKNLFYLDEGEIDLTLDWLNLNSIRSYVNWDKGDVPDVVACVLAYGIMYSFGGEGYFEDSDLKNKEDALNYLRERGIELDET